MTEPSDGQHDGWAVVRVPLDSEPPGPISTEEDEDQDDDLPLIPPAPPSTGPPGASIFSLEGRPAAGLYLVGWLLSLGGFALLFMTFLAAAEGVTSAKGVAPILILVAVVLLGLGLAAGAGYQIVARTQLRPPEAYRGPSPAIAFGVALLLAGFASVGLAFLGVDPIADAFGFLVSLIAVEAAYFLVVWLFVVRSGAMTWRDMGWPVHRPARAILVDLIYGPALMVPTLFAIGILARIVQILLGDVPVPNVVPGSHGGTDTILLALATILVAPVGEELFFRGFALTAWWRDLGARSALIRSAVFFALIHIVNVQSVDFATGLRQVILILVQIIPLGLVLGWLFVRRGIVASIAGHAAYNAVIFLVALTLTNLPNV